MLQSYTFLHKINENENIFVLNFVKVTICKLVAAFGYKKIHKMATRLLWCFFRLHNNLPTS